MKQLSNLLFAIAKIKRSRYLFALVVFLAGLFVVIQMSSKHFLLVVPVEGGTVTEGIVGTPRFVNPILAISQVDKDLSALVFSGLFKKNANGQVVPDLAQSYEANEEFTQYSIKLRSDVTFHDGQEFDSRDVLFTYQTIQDPLIKSPNFPRYINIDVTASSSHEVVFELPAANPNFIELLTTGLLSAEQWGSVSVEEFAFAQANVAPNGTGPFALENVSRGNNQRIDAYTLAANRSNNRSPYIDNVVITFYEDQLKALEAFENNRTKNLANITAQELLELDRALEQKEIQAQPLSRVFALFYNLNDDKPSVLENKTLRSVIDDIINRQAIVDNVFFGRASTATGPLPVQNTHYSQQEDRTASNIGEILDDLGWKYATTSDLVRQKSTSDNVEYLSFTAHVPDAPELVKTAEIIKQQLAEHGIGMTPIVIPEAEFSQQIIRKRNFESVLFGHIVDTSTQLYAFWHSSGRADPGVNVSGYSNSTVDTVLTRLTGASSEESTVSQDYLTLQKEVRKDLPASFLYTPHFIYATDQDIQQNNFGVIDFAQDRFNEIEHWYIYTESLLPFFDITGR